MLPQVASTPVEVLVKFYNIQKILIKVKCMYEGDKCLSFHTEQQ